MALIHEMATASPDERRAYPRYSPDPLVPVLFGHPASESPTAGVIADISLSGLRIVAPPTARPYLHWADPILVEVSYSESTRAAGIEGSKLRAYVVRLVVDSSGLQLHARFDPSGPDGKWNEFRAWMASLGTGEGPR